MLAMKENLERVENALKRSMENVKRRCDAYITRQNRDSYFDLVEALAWADATRMECEAVRSVANLAEVPFEVTEETKEQLIDAQLSA